MRLIALLIALFPKFSANLHQILSAENRRLDPKDFLVEVLLKLPNELHVRVVGPNMIAIFEFAHNGVVYSTVFYKEDGVMPEIYRALLHAAVESSTRGLVQEPFWIIDTDPASVAHYLGVERMRVALRGRSTKPADAEA